MKPKSNSHLVALLGIATASTLGASTLYWDGNNTTANADGGAGGWNITSTNWNDAATSGTAVAWPSSGTDNDAVFGTPAGLVTIDAGGVSANDLTFGLTGYAVDGGALTLNGTTNILTSSAAVSPTPVTNLTISAPLAGTNGFTKAGVGNVVLSGDNTGISGIVTINSATGTNNSGVGLSGANAAGGITQFDVNDGSFLSLSNTSLGAGTTLNLTGGGGNSAPIGTLKGSAGATVVGGPVNILNTTVRISNYGGTSLTLNGAVTATPSTSGISFRFAQNQGVILTNTGNSWGGTTVLGEGSLYCYPGTLPATTNLQIGGSNPADFGTNGSFTRALGTAAGQVQFGRANDGQRAMGFSARGGALTVNLGGAAADLVCLNTFAKTGATNATVTVTLTDATNIVAGMSVTGSGIPVDTLVSTVVGTTVTLNKAATTTVASNALTFYAAANTARLNSSILVLNGANADSALTFQNPVDLNGFTRYLQVSANTATLTGGLKNSSATAASVRKTGTGTLIHDPGTAHTVTLAGLNANAGTLELKSGTITVSGSAGTTAPDSTTGFVVARGGTFRLNGGNVTCTSGSFVFPAGNTSGGGNNFILDSGTFDAGTKEALNAYGAGGTTTLNGGLFICGDFRVGQSSTCGLNLNGGTLRTNLLKDAAATTATVNLNGGTLQAKAAQTSFIDPALDVVQVQSLGAVIDSNGFAITIPKLLTEDSGSTGGGLTKKGSGILDLTADNTYTGTTTINGGVLRVSASSKLGISTAPVTINGGEFGVSGTAIPSISSLGRTFTYTTGGFHVADVTHTLDVDIALTGSAALSKSGPGTIKLSGANDFTGGITMGSGDNGWIEVDSATDLGTGAKIANMASSTGGSIGGIRLLGGVTVSNVALNIGGRNPSPATEHALWNLSGNNVWTGDVNITNSGGTYYLRSDGGQLELSGTLSNAQPANPTADTRAFNLEGPGDYLISGMIADGAANRFTALIMEGTGTATLTGNNTYTGSTAVTAGTLALVGGSQKSPITVSSGATLGFTLGSPTTSTSTITFSGATAKVKVTGTPVAATLMTATAITGTPVLDPAIPGFELAIEGGGTLLNLKSVSSDSYNTWAATTNGLAGGNAAATADPDSDGFKNAIEFVIGGQPNPANPNASSSVLAPTSVLDPANLVFTYRRTDLAMTQPGIAITVDYGSDLTGWTTAVNGTGGVSIVVTNDGFGAGVDKVEVTIPRALATGSKFFARLNVVIP